MEWRAHSAPAFSEHQDRLVSPGLLRLFYFGTASQSICFYARLGETDRGTNAFCESRRGYHHGLLRIADSYPQPSPPLVTHGCRTPVALPVSVSCCQGSQVSGWGYKSSCASCFKHYNNTIIQYLACKVNTYSLRTGTTDLAGLIFNSSSYRMYFRHPL